MDIKLLIFQDVTGVPVAVNPANVSCIMKSGEAVTDVNFVGGGVTRVKLSFESTVARFLEGREPEAK